MYPAHYITKAKNLLHECEQRGLMISTAESCTGGLISALLTEIAGASAVYERGFITYSNHAKHALLGVSEKTLNEHGAVSNPVAMEMARGAITHSAAQLSMAVTGIAGPGGGTPAKPVGLVYIAAQLKGHDPAVKEYRFSGDRAQVRLAAVEKAIDLAQSLLIHTEKK